ncbi:DUF3291 domain-containing protein [Glycomyces sp. TRM65418]|uniref:DUF3291 domain-containing protein n=1 Tax=Glycomyces sp. TRM65418 TaxID=2867006 RepID=UPI001CE56C86|nr:DUF3291 domain-containing protein [Glycomyces sp. TRM65418]MCC3761922.1 DUF3291 domain-containing protein [Glycomyces sp. TRM65418]QZD56002.1 DUF3291 domain-containing protein [Glycomyces sp. TRM65418]
MTAGYELAQVNIGRMLAPLDSPAMRDFVDNLDEVNAAAEAAEGFVWRLVDEEGDNATGFRFYGDEWLIVNMSVWTSAEALRAYVYGPAHRPFLQRRREWFEHLAEAITALWWVPAGERPTVEEAEKRLTLLREKGPTIEAFTMKDSFANPEA